MDPTPEVTCELTAQELLDLPPAADTSIEIEDIATIDITLPACTTQQATVNSQPADETELELELNGTQIDALLESTMR